MKNKEIEFETLHSNKHRIHFLIGFVCVVVLLVVFIVGTSHARYRVTESIPLVNGTINYSLADLNIVAITVDGEAIDAIPEGNYELTENSYCTVNGEEDSSISISYEADKQLLTVTPFTTKGTKCYLDFTEKTSVGDIILGNVEVNESTPNFASVATTDEGVYATTDNLGTSYYFRGAVTNNYVQFAGFCWRIIRINGDGSIRIIYDGTNAHANGESSDDRQTGTSAFNSSYNQSYYVGYTYTTSQRPSTQNSWTASTIKGALDSWYATNISGKGLDDKVVNTPGFCNDRNTATGSNWISSGTTFYYAARDRLQTNKKPILDCNDNSDLYTTKVGLVTADEVAIAGGVYGSSNNSYYLYTGDSYWTMSPHNFSGSFAYAFVVDNVGYLDNASVNATIGVRPVINIASNVTITGSGTISDPYVVL